MCVWCIWNDISDYFEERENWIEALNRGYDYESGRDAERPGPIL